MTDSLSARTGTPLASRAPLNRGPEMGPSQRDTPGNETQPARDTMLDMMFDADGYALTHNRNLFAASRVLSDLIEKDGQWPVFANALRDRLAARALTPDHIDQQIARLEPLFAPWLEQVRLVPSART